MSTRLIAALIVACSIPAFGAEEDPANRPDHGPPYAPSRVITGFELDWSTHQRHAPGSDNWPMTWADDDHQYTAWGDGGGFGGTNSRGRVSLGVARIEGPAENYRGVNVWGGVTAPPPDGPAEPPAPATFKGKSYGMLSVGGVLYMWRAPDPLPHLTETRIAWSDDHGRTWQLADWAFTFDDGLTIPTFINFGRDYAGARDQYVYSYYIQPRYGPGRSTSPFKYQSGFDVHRPGAIHLSRVPKDRILDRAAYEFFAGLDDRAEPTWTRDVTRKKPAFEDANGVGWNVSATYHAGLKRYLLCTEHTRSHLGMLGIFDAPEPWGPWTTVVYDDAWGDGHVPVDTFYWSFPAKWISPDGRGFTFMFTGRTENDSFNTVRGRFKLASEK